MHGCRSCGSDFPATEEFFYRAGKYFNWICKPCMVVSTVAYKRQRFDRPGPRPIVCAQCAAQFISGHKQARFCARECLEAHRAERDKAARRESRPARTCPHCGSIFTASSVKQFFCSSKCNSAAHNLARKLFRRSGRPRRDGLLERSEIAKRDGWRCGICGDAIDPELRHPDPFCLSIDHVLPVAAGGSSDLSNLQPAHLRCNLSKRDRGSQQLRLV